MAQLQLGLQRCSCARAYHPTRFVVITGGPGAGKTAVLEMAARVFCQHTAVLPESASIVFGGGFPRLDSEEGRRASQRAIYYVQREVEQLVASDGHVGLALCDRGVVDGIAYWPGTPESFWQSVGSSREEAFERYAAVIHMSTPPANMGYNHQNPVRIETAGEAQAIDARIREAWSGHPNHKVIEATDDFLDKVIQALKVIREDLPDCCRSNHTKPDAS